MLAKLFNSGQRNAQRYIKQLSHGDVEQRLALLTQMRHAQDSGALQPVPVPLQQFFTSSWPPKTTPRLLALVAWIDDLDALASLLSNDVTQQAAAKRVVELNPTNSDLINDPRVVNERITSASAGEVNALVVLQVLAEQLATLAVRAHPQDQPHVLSQPMLRSEKGLIALEKYSRGHNKACHKHARAGIDAIKSARRAKDEALQRLQELDDTIVKTLGKHTDERPDFATLQQHRTRLKLLSENRQQARGVARGVANAATT